MEKKEFIYPELIIIEFVNEDIILTSGTLPGENGYDEDWPFPPLNP